MKLDVISAKEIAIKLNTNSFNRKNISLKDLKNIFDDNLINDADMSKTDYISKNLREIDEIEYSIHMFREFIDIRLFEYNVENQINYVDDLNTVLEVNGLKLKKSLENYNMINLNDLTEPDTIEIKHNGIKATILEAIESAKYLIWINVAWFTEIDIMRSLYKKMTEGVNVQIIVQKNSANMKRADEFNTYFEIYWFEPFGRKSRYMMHRKNCMIDFEKVIMGSYNYTENAESHFEDIAIIEGIEIARVYATEFMKLKKIVLEKQRQNNKKI